MAKGSQEISKDKQVQSLPIVELSLKSTRSVNDISKDIGEDPAVVRHELERALKEHYFLFGTRPYSIEYSPMHGHVLRARSSIGFVRVGRFILRINPKIKSLNLDNCVGLAQACQFGFLAL